VVLFGGSYGLYIQYCLDPDKACVFSPLAFSSVHSALSLSLSLSLSHKVSPSLYPSDLSAATGRQPLSHYAWCPGISAGDEHLPGTPTDNEHPTPNLSYLDICIRIWSSYECMRILCLLASICPLSGGAARPPAPLAHG
jgi:hypothetical protein